MRPSSTAALAVLCLGSAALALHGAPTEAESAAQGRVCRSIIPVLNARDAKLTIVSTEPVGRTDGVIVTYDAVVPGASRPRLRRLVCAFTKRAQGVEELLMVASDGRVLGVPRMTFLKRYYLRSRDAESAEAALLQPPAAKELQRPKRQP